MSVKHLYLIAVAAILGCAPVSGTSVTPGAGAVPRRANILTAEEIVAANADVATVYDAVSRLRPIWLAARGETSFYTPGTQFPILFVDGQAFGDLKTLRNIQASHVADIRLYSPSEAGGIFGLRGGTGGVIEVRMKQALGPSRP